MSKENEVSQQTGISNFLFELFGTSLILSFSILSLIFVIICYT